MVLAIGAAALPPLIVASTLGLMLTTLVSGAETDFDEASTIGRRLSNLRLEIEHENSLIGRIPAELDLAVVKRQAVELAATARRIDDAMGLLTSNARIVTRDVAMEIGVLRQQRSRIVDGIVAAASSFSQTAALELLNGPFEETSATLLLLLDAIGSRVDSIAQIARTNLQTSTQAAWQLTPAALLAVFCMIALTGWMSRREFVQPLLQLKEYAQKIGASDVLELRPDRASLERRDEIGALARAFDAMVRELAEARSNLIARSDAEIARQAERLQAALTNMVQGLCMTDNDQRLVICNKRYAEIYALPDELTKPGTDMTTILMHQVAQGLFPAEEAALIMGRGTGSAVVETHRWTHYRYSAPADAGGWRGHDPRRHYRTAQERGTRCAHGLS
ncbi:MAG: HAMP domain-containing protein [Rhodospirillales bacterium]|nr:HAMP domain-containing protein [Rhodospirillales bacterium]